LRSAAEVRLVASLADEGLNSCEISRRTGIPRSTIVNWRHGRVPMPNASRSRTGHAVCIQCAGFAQHPFPHMTEFAYAYLLGLYLGDGCLLRHRRGVFRLNIAMDAKYPRIIEEAVAAASLAMPSSKASARPNGRHHYVEVNSLSQHWPCLFPQHGPGRKHERRITLEPWQREIVDRHPWRFLRGLIHSDGCRCMNRIRHPKKTYAYPRYLFSDRSNDIRNLFCEYCEAVGVEWRQMNRWNISVARRDSVALMDRYIGSKR
jgi:hypothetical protein